AVDEVEPPVRVGRVVRVQAVQRQGLQQGDLVQRSARDVVDVDTRGGVVVDEVEAEVLPVHLERTERVDVLHHQVPHRQPGVRDGGFQQLQHEGIGGAHPVRGELTHLEG
ncbi:MAG: hypothetical protein ACK56I_20035, partial [bacterium]